jgi:hypothetical protein
LLALVTASIFFGATIYVNVAEHPARLALDDGAALAHWRPAYKRGFTMQAPIAVLLAKCASIASIGYDHFANIAFQKCGVILRDRFWKFLYPL